MPTSNLRPVRVTEVYRGGRHTHVFKATLRRHRDWDIFGEFLDDMQAVGATAVSELCVACDVPPPAFWRALVEGQASHGTTGGEK